MSPWAERLREKYYRDEVHPYRRFERAVSELLRPDQILVDAGCGRTAPVLQRFRGKARQLIGIDLVSFDPSISGITLLNRDLTRTNLRDESVDVIMSRSVMEHITDPISTYSEMNRILRPGGHFVFLTANLWDYAAIIAKLVPNRYHPRIVAMVEGREEKDVFPVHYRTNTRRAIARFADQTGFEIVSLEYLGQYPNYFLFNGLLFLIATGYEKFVDKIRPLHFLKGWILATLRKRG
jgi:SAM-dependent methyltransferase